tara:strand:- start:151 stop:501 length:351 start_codon:yes stop_codon:yes gene_type:complete
MEYTIDFESVDKKILLKIFSTELTKNIDMLEDCDYESFLETCVNNTIHIIKLKEKLGKSVKIKDNFPSVCIFCNDLMKKNELKRSLPCGHEYHKKCIDKWVFKYYSNSCPCCGQII